MPPAIVRFRSVIVFPILAALGLYLGLSRSASAQAPVAEQLQNSFRTARKALAAGQYASARLLFEEILSEAPRDELAGGSAYYVAVSYFLEGNYATALVEFDRYNRDYPQNEFIGHAEYFRGECYYYLRDYPRAADTLRSFLDKRVGNPYEIRAWYTLGYVYSQQERFAEAVDTFARALAKFPADKLSPEIHLKMGEAYFNNRQYREARRVFREILLKGGVPQYDASSLADDAQFWTGRAWFAEKNYAEARREFAFVLDKFPGGDTAPNAAYYIALAYIEEKNYFEAQNALQKMREQFPQSALVPASLYREGELLRSQGRHKEAIMRYQTVISGFAATEWYGEAVPAMAESLLALGEKDRALQLFETAAARADMAPAPHALVLLKAGHLLYRKREYSRARVYYDKLAADHPEQPAAGEALLYSAKILVNNGDTESARARVDAGLEKIAGGPTREEFALLSADLFFRARQYDKALQEYTRILRNAANPQAGAGAAARLGIGYSYFELRQYARAADEFRSLTGEPLDPPALVEDARLALTACQYNLRQFEEAVSGLTALAERGKSARIRRLALFDLAWTHYRRDDFPAALARYAEFIAKYPKDDKIIEARYYAAWASTKNKDFETGLAEFRRVADYANDKYRKDDERPAAARLNARINELKPAALFYAGKNAQALGRLELALDFWKKLAQDFPSSELIDDAFYEAALLYADKGDAGRALETITRLEKAQPASPYIPDFYFALAGRLKLAGKEAEARKYYAYVAQQYPENGLAHTALYEEGLSHFRGGRYQDSLKAFRSYITRFPSKNLVDDAYLYVGQSLWRLGQEKDAFIAWETAFDKMVPARRFEARMQIALAHFQRKNHKDAKKELAYLARQPGQAAQALYQLGLLSRELKNEATAFDYFKQAGRAGQDEFAARALLEVGDYYFSRERWKEAAAAYIRVVHSFSQYADLVPPAIFRAADSFARAGELPEARKYRQMLQDEYPKSEYIAKIKTLKLD